MSWNPLVALDRLLVWCATPLGARTPLLIGLYTGIYAVCLLPIHWLALAALGVGYISVLALGRAWVANEAQRGRIAKKLADGDPDDLPDLRGAALFSALQLAVVFPLLFYHLQAAFHLYRVPEGTTLFTWVAFTFDSFTKMFVNFTEIYDAAFTRIEYASPWGRHLVLLKRLTFDLLLVQGFLRVLHIRSQVREAVAAIGQDVDLAVRLGRRAVPALLRLSKHSDPIFRRQAARALGLIRDPATVGPLSKLLRDENALVREAAAQALGELGDTQAVEPLIAVLLKDRSEKIVLFHDRQQAAQSLGNLGDARAVPSLVQLLHQGTGAPRQAAQVALEKIQRHRVDAGLLAVGGSGEYCGETWNHPHRDANSLTPSAPFHLLGRPYIQEVPMSPPATTWTQDIEQYREALLQIARRLLRSRPGIDPSEVVQVTLKQAMEAPEAPRNPEGWLRGVLKYRVIDACRQADRQAFEQLPMELPGTGTTPSGDAVRRENCQRVQDALARLRPAERDVLELSYFLNLTWTQEEIAEHLGLTRGAVAGLHRRALSNLRNLLKDPE